MNVKLIESQVLGCCLLSDDCLQQVIKLQKVEYFYTTQAKQLFNKFIELTKAMKPIDITLFQSGALDQVLSIYAFECQSNVATVEMFDSYLLQFTAARIRRELKLLTGVDIDDSENINEAIGNLVKKLNALKLVEEKDQKQVMYEIMEDFEDLKIRGNEMDSGIPYFDKLTNGFKRKRIYILGGMPGTGKTGFALCMAHRIAFTRGKKVLFFSLEMATTQIVGRLASIMNNVPSSRIQSPSCMTPENWIALSNTCQQIYNSSLKIMDGLKSIGEIIAITKKEKPDIIFIDHLQQIALNIGKNEHEHQLLSYAVRDLKELSNENNLCVFLLSQNKRNESGKYKEENIEFRGSSSIKEQCDLGMILIRDKETTEPVGLLDLHIIKNRHGDTDKKIKLMFDRDTLRYAEFFMQKDNQ